MLNLSLTIKNKAGEVKEQSVCENNVSLLYCNEYEEGDIIIFECSKENQHVVLQLDDAIGSSIVYLTGKEFIYTIPFGEKRISYSPKSFMGDRHLLTARLAFGEEVVSYRNLAENKYDLHGEQGCYPHAVANVETRGEAVFAARNAIDGNTCNRSHGGWPYESWGINCQDDAQIELYFGRLVEIDKMLLYTRADFPHDNWWEKVTFEFSDGSVMDVDLEKSYEPHVISFEPKKVEWVRLLNLIKADDPSPFPALSQWVVYGGGDCTRSST